MSLSLRDSSPKRCTARSRRLVGGPHEPMSEPTQWLPSPYPTATLRDTLFMRTRGTGPEWTTQEGSLDMSIVTLLEGAATATGSFSSGATGTGSRCASPSRLHDPAFLNGGMSLHRTAKATGHLSPTRARAAPTHGSVVTQKFATQPLQRGGITYWGHR